MPPTKTLHKNSEPVKTGFFIGVPHTIEDSELDNLKTLLGEIWRDNHETYLIQECGQCDECGAINRTVSKMDISYAITDMKTKKRKIMDKEEKNLCDHCAKVYLREQGVYEG